MLTDIINAAVTALRSCGAGEVYSAFDAYPTELKSRGFFTVVGTGGLEYCTPIYSYSTVFIPFRAKLEISVTAPENSSMTSLYEYFDSKIAPAADQLSDLSGRLTKLSLKHDSNIGRLVLTAEMSVSGVRHVERSSP